MFCIFKTISFLSLAFFLSAKTYAYTQGLTKDQFREARNLSEDLWRKQPAFFKSLQAARQSILLYSCVQFSDGETAKSLSQKAYEQSMQAIIGKKVVMHEETGSEIKDIFFKSLPSIWQRAFRTYSLDQEEFIIKIIASDTADSMDAKFLNGKSKPNQDYTKRQLWEVYQCSIL